MKMMDESSSGAMSTQLKMMRSRGRLLVPFCMSLDVSVRGA